MEVSRLQPNTEIRKRISVIKDKSGTSNKEENSRKAKKSKWSM